MHLFRTVEVLDISVVIGLDLVFRFSVGEEFVDLGGRDRQHHFLGIEFKVLDVGLGFCDAVIEFGGLRRHEDRVGDEAAQFLDRDAAADFFHEPGFGIAVALQKAVERLVRELAVLALEAFFVHQNLQNLIIGGAQTEFHRLLVHRPLVDQLAQDVVRQLQLGGIEGVLVHTLVLLVSPLVGALELGATDRVATHRRCRTTTAATPEFAAGRVTNTKKGHGAQCG